MKIDSRMATKRMFKTFEIRLYVTIVLAKSFLRVIHILLIAFLLAGAVFIVVSYEANLPDEVWAKRFENMKSNEANYRFPKY